MRTSRVYTEEGGNRPEMDIEKINYLYGIDFPNRKIVPGEGNPRSNILLIGEAPGREEEAQGRPFVGKAGKNLAEFLDLIKLKREDIFITNAVKFRPTKLSEYGSVSNRTPTENEVADYLPYLKLTLPNGKTLEIKAPGVSDKKRYVQSLKLNGESYDKMYITHEDILKGGVLEFKMSASPNKRRGVSVQDKPYSLTNGIN